jgi:hypothetical protein
MIEASEVTAALRYELAALRDVNGTLPDLFYSVCPARLLSDLDPELLDVFDSAAFANPKSP